MLENLKKDWTDLFVSEKLNLEAAERIWQKFEKEYGKKTRAYHNFSHLENMLSKLKRFENELEDLSVLKFSIWFHDVIYLVTRKDNELKSAEIARRELTELGFDETRIQRCFDQIMSTKAHALQGDFQSFDEKLMLDLDLDVLSWEWGNYLEYTRQIRREYRIYLSFLYKKGRAVAMSKFLEREQIYFTDYYHSEKESIARENLKNEIKLLSF